MQRFARAVRAAVTARVADNAVKNPKRTRDLQAEPGENAPAWGYAQVRVPS